MSEHFLKEVNIINYKCFQNFECKNFNRINLISGKNNVGKTTFIEALYINSYPYSSQNNTSMAISDIIFTRYNQTFFQDLLLNKGMDYIKTVLKEKIASFDSSEIRSNINHTISKFEESDLGIRDKNNSIKYFLTSSKTTNDKLEEAYGIIIEKEMESKIDEIIKYIDPNIKSFRIINSKPKCNFITNPEFVDIHELGEGLFRFLSLIFSLYICNNSYLFIDEIENGFHYSKLEKIWELIFTISEEVNCQIFATTHSKEMINAFAKTSKKLRDKDISFVELGRNKDNEIKAITMNYDRLHRELNSGNEIRGW